MTSPTFLCIFIDWGWKQPRLPLTFYIVEGGFELSPSFFHLSSAYIINLGSAFSKHVLTQDMTQSRGFQHALLSWDTVLGIHQQSNSFPGVLPRLFVSDILAWIKFTLLRDTGHYGWLSEKTLGTDLSPPSPCLKAQPLLASWDRILTHSVCLVWVTGDSVPWNTAYVSCFRLCCSTTGEIYRRNFQLFYKGRPCKEADGIEHTSIDFTIHRPSRRSDNININTVNDGLTNRKKKWFLNILVKKPHSNFWYLSFVCFVLVFFVVIVVFF